MKKLVWLFGILLALSFVVPDKVFKPAPPAPPATPAVPAVAVPTDTNIVSVLANATAEDRANIVGIYTGLKTVILRDKGEFVNNTDRWSVLQANTLKLAVDQVGKYPGLDRAIESVFMAEVGTDDVTSMTPDTITRVVKACDVIIASAAAK